MGRTRSESLQLRAKAELERRRRAASTTTNDADQHLTKLLPWRDWLSTFYPRYVSKPFAQRHIDLWEWVEALTTGERPRPFVAIWPRGGAKSTSAELACVRVGARRSRRYIWYVSSTQDKADKHVDTIASLLESDSLGKDDPKLASRKVGKYGNSKGWRRNRLRTASGLTIDAVGLDTGTRGAKIEDARPDLMILDDIDERHDSLAATKKKIELITTSLLPAGSGDLAILFIQNKIHTNSIASQLGGGKAEFLVDRIVSGPHPAVIGLTYEMRFDEPTNRNRYFITGGAPTWEGQDLATCEKQINDWGPTAFLQEAQHMVEQKGGIWDHVQYRHCKWDEVPWGSIVRSVVWVDPAVTSTDDSDSMGIQADCIASDGTIYRLFSWESITSPLDALMRAIRKGMEIGAQHVGVETDQGGETWSSVYAEACREIEAERRKQWEERWLAEHPGGGPVPDMPPIVFPSFTWDKAGAGYGSKIERNARMLVDYEQGRVVHVEGTHEALEQSLSRFPLKPLDLADAAFWAWNDLRNNVMQIFL
jgi:hypothetical protein